MSNVKVDTLDISVLVFYFLSVLITGFIAMFASKRGTVSGFFLAGRFMSWLPIGASLFASNIGSEHFIGLAGSGAASGIGVGAFELNASLLLQLLGWVFLPVYIASGVSTLPEYMSRRFGGKRIQVYLAALSLLLYAFTKISVNLYSGSLFLTEALQWNIWISIVLLLGLTSVITVTGGLAAVLYTDTLQFFVMIIGSILLAILSFVRVGGFEGVLARYGSAIARINATSHSGSEILRSLVNLSAQTNMTSLNALASNGGLDPRLGCSLPSPKAFKLLRGISDPDMPWLGFILGQTPASIWYWCADQMMVQRVLSAKSLSHAQGATLMAGLIKQLPLFIMVIPGMISRILYSDEVACIPGNDCLRICGQTNGCSNMAYPKLVVGLMPSGLRGLMLAVMLAALISDLTSIFNSASTLFTVDIYRRFRKQAKEAELMLVGKLFVLLLVLISIAWIPVIQELQGSQLYIYIQAISAYLAPPIAAVYLLAILWSRLNEQGAFYALIYGLLIGLIRMMLSIVYRDPVCGQVDNRPWIIGQLHYMYFGMFSFMTTGLVMIVASLVFGTRPSRDQVHRLTYSTAWDPPLPTQQVYESSSDAVSSSEMQLNDRSGATKTLGAGDVLGTWPESKNNNNNNNNNNACQEHAYLSLKVEPAFVIEKSLDVEAITTQPSGLCTCTPKSESSQCALHAIRWICGCEDRPCPDAVEERCMDCVCCGKLKSIRSKQTLHAKADREHFAAEQYAIRLQKIISLSQNPQAKLALRIGLVVTVLISLFGFIFFSVYFDTVEAGPIPVYLAPNVTLEENTRQAVQRLQQLGLVKLL